MMAWTCLTALLLLLASPALAAGRGLRATALSVVGPDLLRQTAFSTVAPSARSPSSKAPPQAAPPALRGVHRIG